MKPDQAAGNNNSTTYLDTDRTITEDREIPIDGALRRDASADRLFGHEGAKMYASDVAPRGGCSETSSMFFSLVLLSCGLPSD